VVVFDGFVIDCFEDDYQLFRGTYCLNLQGTSCLKMDAVYSSIMTTTRSHSIKMPEEWRIKPCTLTIMPKF
jgi:hypothetical protein